MDEMRDDVSERWATIPRFPNYEFSDIGRVRSYWKPGGSLRIVPKILKQHVSPRGYWAVRIYDSDGVHRMCQVHRLVLEAFVGPCPDGLEGCHEDGDRLNPRLDNLYWGTRKENCHDTSRHGRNRNSVLSPSQVEEAVQMHCDGRKQSDIARHFGVNQGSISSLLIRRGYRRIRKDFTPEEIYEIISMRDSGASHKEIADRFQSTVKTIGHVFYRMKKQSVPVA